MLFRSPTPGQNSVLNALYCAPNKIYEYARYGVPIIGNDIPGLRSVVNEYRNGVIVSEITKEEVKKKILKINESYEGYSKKSKGLYESCDNEKTVKEIIRMSMD